MVVLVVTEEVLSGQRVELGGVQGGGGVLLHPRRLSEAISHLWAAGGISQQHFPSLRREKARVHHGKPAHIITSVLFQT